MEIGSVSNVTVNRPTVSSNTEAVEGTAESVASTTGSTEKKTTGAGGYISPFIRYDHDARVAVLLFRDVDTGETQDQIPSPRVVDEYRRAASRLGQPGTPSNGKSDGTAKPDGNVATGAPARGVSFASGTPPATATAPTAFGAPSEPAPTNAASDAASGGASPGGLVSVKV